MNYFKNLNYKSYLEKYPFHKLLNIDLKKYGKIDKKVVRSIYETVDPSNKTPFSTELDDLVRLHYLVTSRKVTTILEFGIGCSTPVFDHALLENKKKYAKYVNNNLRRSNPFECHSIDNNKKWISYTKKQYPFTKNTTFHFSDCHVTTFNSKMCTMYDKLPNICPDLIYLDAPDQFSPKGSIRGLSLRHSDRLPMAADILTLEHFLLPGTLIVVDGRTANARFLKCNLQRNWNHYHSITHDAHYFELKETPLGIFNRKQIEFSLGKNWLKRLK
tara:strand:- start:543 stop:1361 length:819 start_codon:yes stop_codon:yes gene_type:complete